MNSYSEDLNRLGHPNYMILDNKYVIVKSTINIGRQAYYILLDGRRKHASQLKKLSESDLLALNRDKLLKNILNER